MTQLPGRRPAALYRRALDAASPTTWPARADRCRLLLAIADAQVRAFDRRRAPATRCSRRSSIARAIGDAESSPGPR